MSRSMIYKESPDNMLLWLEVTILQNRKRQDISVNKVEL